MTEGRISDTNYYQVSGWMINRLGLKGTALQIYAIIYGFTQDGRCGFDGTLSYLREFTNSSKNTVLKALQDLVADGLLKKTERLENGVKYVSYWADLQAVEICLRGGAKTEPGVVQFLHRGGAETEPGVVQKLNPVIINIDNKEDKYKYIVEYLNEKAGTHYRPASKSTQGHIKARLAEGYTVEDFKTVIDKKVKEWKETPFEKYLRPETLFGSKFEGYLNGNVSPGKTGGGTAIPDYGSPEDFYR